VIKKHIPFNKAYLAGKETEYILQAVQSKKISGNGIFTKKCQEFFEKRYGFKKCLLTSSCTDALEMAALLIDIKPGDQVIIPSYTFVSTANAFVLRGADIVFADSEENTPNLDAGKIEPLITSKTKAIVVVHYAGVACDMDKIMDLAAKHDLVVVEDAAQCIDSYYRKKPLGGIGHLGTFSFHETKNITSGEGGMIVINDERFMKRSEILWEKGTNRAAFWRGEVKKYEWVDIGSSFLPSEITAAFLFAQLESIDEIQKKRIQLWNNYNASFRPLMEEGFIRLPFIPDYATNNAHMFYILCRNYNERNGLLDFLNKNNINAVSHYLSLHKSPFYSSRHSGRELPFSDQYSDCLIRLPFYYELGEEDIIQISKCMNAGLKELV
jgi:dTDP-4-amino-4,6-dideoxygalactose transaminase